MENIDQEGDWGPIAGFDFEGIKFIWASETNPPPLSFSSQEDALNFARHVAEDSKRRLAA